MITDEKQKMYNELLNIIVKLKKNILTKKLYNHQTETYNELIIQMKKIVNKMIGKYNDESTEDKREFIHKNIHTIYKLYDLFYNKEVKQNILTIIERNNVRGIVDKFYKIFCGIDRIEDFFKYLPTKIFNDFIKGITHFESDTVYTHPNYHRTNSCGKADKEHFTQFEIQDGDDVNTQKHKKNALIQCYIDRLIYNEIYTYILHEQDARHLYEVKILERMVSKYVTINLKLKLSYTKPIKLMIDVFMFRNVPIYREVYTKYKDGRVLAIRVETNEKYRFKVQTYHQKTEWSSIMPKQNQRIFRNLITITSLKSIQSMPDAWLSNKLSVEKHKHESI